jgi:hypothetical protein
MADITRDRDAGSNGKARTARPSSMLRAAAALPSVDHALDEFIARATQTEVAIDTWSDDADPEAAQRSRTAEAALREAEARAQALRAQLEDAQRALARATSGDGRGAQAPAAAPADGQRSNQAATAAPRAAEPVSRGPAAPALSWPMLVGAFVAGLAVMFIVWQLVGARAAPASTTSQAPPRPVVTPIDPGKAAGKPVEGAAQPAN